MNIEFSFNDALVLEAIYTNSLFFRKGAKLRDIISYGDCFNRSILSYNDIKIAIQKLLILDYVIIKNNRIKATSLYEKLKRKNIKKEKKIFEMIESVFLFLKNQESIFLKDLVELPENLITESLWKKEYVYYISEFKTK